MKTGLIGSLFAALLFGTVLAGPAWPACNTVPDSAQIYGIQPRDAVLPFRGVRGRINTPFILQEGQRGEGDVLLLGDDPVCGADDPDAGKIGREIAAEDLVVVIYPSPASGRPPIVLNAGDQCAALRKSAPKALVLDAGSCRDHAEVTVVPSDPPAPASAALRDRQLVRVVPPVSAALPGGPTKIVVSTVAKGIPGGLDSQSCADALDANALDALICVDTLYGDAFDRCGTSRADIDPGIGGLLTLPPDNDFAKLCRQDMGKAPYCDKDGSAVQIAVDDTNGTLHVPMSYARILKRKLFGGYRNRHLGGSLADSRFPRPETGEIYMPAREFLGSLPNPNSGNPDKPFLYPAVEAGRPHEFNIHGHADEERSNVLLFPRRLVTLVCDGGNHDGEACEGVVATKRKCVCGLGGVVCDKKCRKLSKSDVRYFECKGGPFPGMPCTRPAHCKAGNEAGRCIAEPRCRKRDQEEADGSPCKKDSDCTTAPYLECGNMLFDFRSRATGGALTIDRVIDHSGGVGVCEEGGKSCSKPGDCADDAPCVRFRLDAYEEP